MKEISMLLVWIVVVPLLSCHPADRTRKPVTLVSFQPTTCDGASDPYRLQNRIAGQQVKQDTLYLEIAFAENCCIEFHPRLTHAQDTVRLVLDGRESTKIATCRCQCCFGATVVISGVRDTTGLTILLQGEPIRQRAEKYKVYPVSFTIEGKDTINYQDRDGYKHGLWKEYGPKGELRSEKDYREDVIITARYYDGVGHLQSYYDSTGSSKHWDQDQHVEREIQARGDTVIDREYYPGGSKKKECIRIQDKKEHCRHWNRAGKAK